MYCRCLNTQNTVLHSGKKKSGHRFNEEISSVQESTLPPLRIQKVHDTPKFPRYGLPPVMQRFRLRDIVAAAPFFLGSAASASKDMGLGPNYILLQNGEGG